MRKGVKEMSKTSNRGRVGTLQGLCKQTIKQNKIPMDEIEEMVFGFHDEKNEIEKSFTPPKSNTVVLPYESDSQTNQFSSFE